MPDLPTNLQNFQGECSMRLMVGDVIIIGYTQENMEGLEAFYSYFDGTAIAIEYDKPLNSPVL